MAHNDSPPRSGVLTKRALVLASHAVERAALASGGQDMLVMAMFQRLPYFERERRVYTELAALASCTVVGLVDRVRPDLPHGVTPVLLRESEELAREWSVVVLSPTFGAAVVAHDLERVEARASSLESARLFEGRWGMRRDEAYAEAVRLRDALGDRLPPSARAGLDRVLRGVVEQPASEVELRVEAVVRHLLGRLERTRTNYLDLREKVDADRGFGRDPWTGLHSAGTLAPWLGLSAPDTLPLGLALVRVPDLVGMEAQRGARTAMHTENNIADVLRREQRRQDRAFRLSKTEFLLVQPGVSEPALTASGRRLADRIGSALADSYPFVGVTAEVATVISTSRPLPLDQLRASLAENVPPGHQSAADVLGQTAPIPVVRTPSTLVDAEPGA
ncbi:DICT sensory domain-containing protein [Allokutzneria sp. NRRL B-24872]|uniref:DICT sensory domain-containing protein n=1 Tax=Allokutzneria sp. NRRL B-24872 TaxID=1137961 RepID=UPI000A36DC7D|nr:DICT sensory domain-containing protein [Allokutzneria sp. NRRL B-24872]